MNFESAENVRSSNIVEYDCELCHIPTNAAAAAAAGLWPLYRTTCVSQHPLQLRTGGFWCSAAKF